MNAGKNTPVETIPAPEIDVVTMKFIMDTMQDLDMVGGSFGWDVYGKWEEQYATAKHEVWCLREWMVGMGIPTNILTARTKEEARTERPRW